jgi:hypothetical protein
MRCGNWAIPRYHERTNAKLLTFIQEWSPEYHLKQDPS